MTNLRDITKEIQTKIKNEKQVDYFTWPGAYPLYYITADSSVLCPKCVNENIDLVSDENDPQWYVIGYDANYEDETLYCDHCNEHIVSAYGNDNDNDA